jgi:hypothetical protein
VPEDAGTVASGEVYLSGFGAGNRRSLRVRQKAVTIGDPRTMPAERCAGEHW